MIGSRRAESLVGAAVQLARQAPAAHAAFAACSSPRPSSPFAVQPSAPVGASGAAAAPAAPPSADLAGALRVLMRHARLADAAELAAAHLQAALRAVPSVGMARTSQVCRLPA